MQGLSPGRHVPDRERPAGVACVVVAAREEIDEGDVAVRGDRAARLGLQVIAVAAESDAAIPRHRRTRFSGQRREARREDS